MSHHSHTQMRQNCQAARAAFARARTEHFALGAFNLDNQETLVAVARAAAAKKAPVLVEVSHGEVEAMGLDTTRLKRLSLHQKGPRRL
jgi:fructose/tagatose bisphosphate aldolase